MTFDFKGKRAIVCGGSRGIGRAIAEALAQGGAAVSIAARGEAGLKSAAAELSRHGGKVHYGVCDLADGGQIARTISGAATALGGVDFLVNNASGFGHKDDEAGWAAGFAMLGVEGTLLSAVDIVSLGFSVHILWTLMAVFLMFLSVPLLIWDGRRKGRID